jgi:hypothetical protein
VTGSDVAARRVRRRVFGGDDAVLRLCGGAIDLEVPASARRADKRAAGLCMEAGTKRRPTDAEARINNVLTHPCPMLYYKTRVSVAAAMGHDIGIGSIVIFDHRLR